uniref:Core protein VP4 n=1 Tax=Japanaut virus TaxID=2547358 RepID=A0A482A4N6_9REOV|nr:VP4 [Japanaut virus]
MPEPHAVLFVTNELRRLVETSYLQRWELKGDETLNELWIENGKFTSDVYCYGKLPELNIRQLRGHGFIFISTHKSIDIKGRLMKVDVLVPRERLKDENVKKLETLIGKVRVKLRKNFGNALRSYAFRRAVVLHGSEAETLSNANPRLHVVCGLPEIPPHIPMLTDQLYRYIDEPTDEKLVSMLDYSCYSAEEVHYVGSGDGRTLLKFRERDRGRFDRITWHLYDPIIGDLKMSNIHAHKQLVSSKSDILMNINTLKKVERLFLWDVSSDRGLLDDVEWEKVRNSEDRKGELIASELSGAFSLAIIKHRVPTHRQEYKCFTSIIIPQPGAPATMYELRNVIRLDGYSHTNREHLSKARYLNVKTRDGQRLVEYFHGLERGRKLKKNIYEYLHIERVDGLVDKRERRADLFYLSNARNLHSIDKIYDVIQKSEIATVWVGREPLYEYDDMVFSRAELMLRVSNENIRCFDGNGAILFLMWREPDVVKLDLNYDPIWAQNFMVSVRCATPERAVPDLSLCRFIGLRSESSLLRLRMPRVHETADVLKEIGLDLSGHLYITLMSGSYTTDLYWWFRMILEWSSQKEHAKLDDIRVEHADLIEWKSEMANKPWHIKQDLVAALAEFDVMTRKRLTTYIQVWVNYLRDH